MLSRFELLVVARAQVSDRAALRRALAVGAVMEELADAAGATAELAGLIGLGSGLDAQLCAANPERRGQVAAELLLSEGAPAEAAAAVRDRWRRPVDELLPLAAALCAAEVLVNRAYGALADEQQLDDLEPFALAHGLARAERRGDPAAARAVACLARLGLGAEPAAARALAALVRARGDLRL